MMGLFYLISCLYLRKMLLWVFIDCFSLMHSCGVLFTLFALPYWFVLFECWFLLELLVRIMIVMLLRLNYGLLFVGLCFTCCLVVFGSFGLLLGWLSFACYLFVLVFTFRVLVWYGCFLLIGLL